MARTYLNADTFAIYKKEGDKDFLIGAQTEVKIKIEPEYNEFTAFDVVGTEQSFKGYKYSVDMSGVALKDDTALVELLDATVTGRQYEIAFFVGSTKYQGTVNVGSFELGGTTKELATYTIPLLGNGALVKLNEEGEPEPFVV